MRQLKEIVNSDNIILYIDDWASDWFWSRTNWIKKGDNQF